MPLHVQPTSSDEPEDQDPESLKLILQASHRIQHLYLVITYGVGMILMDSPSPIALPMIETLNIGRYFGAVPPEVETENPRIRERLFSLPFPFKSMTRLSTLYIGGYALSEVK